MPIGTLRIPSFLYHNNERVDSRWILRSAVESIQDNLLKLLLNAPQMVQSLGIENAGSLSEIILTSGTELEFWVRTPDEKADITKLSASQMLKEQYWKRTQGVIRTALEKCIWLLEQYGLEPEMGHKEVGGISSRIGTQGRTRYAMEQLEIDWKYSAPLQAADNEMFIRTLVSDVFRNHGLEVTFAAKPIEDVAGSGEHTHVGLGIKLSNGAYKNLFSPKEMGDDYMSAIGYGALMGILKNFEVVNPLITATNDGFNRLKPGFEAPICIVASLGHTVTSPSRNRSVLVGLVRDMDNPKSTRFEVRAPNPLSNTYLVLAGLYQAMQDGIETAVLNNYSSAELLAELSKDAGKEGSYLEKDRMYRSEENVFEFYKEEERDALFGKPPATVWENIKQLNACSDKKQMLTKDDVFTEDTLLSYEQVIIAQWATELETRILAGNLKTLREFKKCHENEKYTDLDVIRWEKINDMRSCLMKDSISEQSLFTRIRDALHDKNYEKASRLQIEMNQKMVEISMLYKTYKENLYGIG
jgi:glutamine synthetase